jgi:two-component system, OmpR family, sensor histidine kinase TctE
MAGLRRRLLVMLLLPLAFLAVINAWVDYQAAGGAALQQDQQLLRLVPLIVGSVVAPGQQEFEPPVILLAPAIEDFLKDKQDLSTWAVATTNGRSLIGPRWLAAITPSTLEPEFHSELVGGVTYRIVAQRAHTAAGELVLLLADGSDPRQNWLHALLLKVLLPNLLLVIAAALTVTWAVRRALQPLLDVKDALERRSPRDLSPLDAAQSPEEVRPLVESLNRLFALVNAQAASQRRFIADAAHQLRTPLAGLQAQVEAWAQAVNPPRTDIYTEKPLLVQVKPAQAAITLGASEINRLRNAARRTSQLANQLLALSRADEYAAASQPLHSVDLRELCTSVLAQQLDAASHAGIDLGLDVPEPPDPLIVQGYEWLLRELLVNLCDNAIKYTPAGGSVTLRCQRVGSLGTQAASAAAVDAAQAAHAASRADIVLEVCDDGPGIPAAERALVLQRFYRVQGTGGEGNGLGLAIADEIARLHGTQLELCDHHGSAVGVRNVSTSTDIHKDTRQDASPSISSRSSSGNSSGSSASSNTNTHSPSLPGLIVRLRFASPSQVA